MAGLLFVRLIADGAVGHRRVDEGGAGKIDVGGVGSEKSHIVEEGV